MSAPGLEPVTRFERTVLMPVEAVLVVSTVALLAEGFWVWSAACAAGLLYLGTIGARLHPLQGPSELARGPWSNPIAELERQVLPLEAKRFLIRQACRRLGWLTSGAVGLLVLTSSNWSWMAVLGLAALSGFLVTAFLTWLFAGSNQATESASHQESWSASSSSFGSPSGFDPVARSPSPNRPEAARLRGAGLPRPSGSECSSLTGCGRIAAVSQRPSGSARWTARNP